MASQPTDGGGSYSGLSPGKSDAAIGLAALVVVSGAVWVAGEAAALLMSGQPLRSGFGAAPKLGAARVARGFDETGSAE